MTVTAQYAEDHFDDLLTVVESGEELIIERPGKAAITLVAKDAPMGNKPRVIGRKHLAGAWEGLISLPTDEEWRAMDKEIEAEMVDAPLCNERSL